MEQKNNKRPKREPAQKDERRGNRYDQGTTERVVVSVPNYHKNLTSTLDFEWPEFVDEHKRIKVYSKRYADTPIPEIFGVHNMQESVPVELRVGDKIPLKIKYITPDGVVFDSRNTKQVLNSSTNLYKFTHFRTHIPDTYFDAEVVRVNRDMVYVDIFKPIFDKWLNDILKDPDMQRNIKQPQVIKVRDLQLTRGGFVGKAVIPVISDIVNQEYTVEAFIPGSQIVLNIENDFEKWNGKDVVAFVTNYINKPGGKGEMSLICSRKEWLKYEGDKQTIQIFNNYCDGGDFWKVWAGRTFEGVVTGIINSSKKCGVFVELPELNITGMLLTDPEKLVEYKPKDKVQVKISGFEENTYFDSVSQQVRHELPYVIEDDVLRSCDVKMLLKLA